MLRKVWRVVRLSLKTVMVLVLTVLIVPPAVVAVGLGIAVFSPAPVTIPTPKKLPPIEATHVYDVYGNEIATFKEFESNIPIAKADVPQVIKQAVVAAEDRNFYAHGGVDIRGTARALWQDLRNRDDPNATVQGGSTITQQYVKLVYETNDAVDAVTAAAAAGADPAAPVPNQNAIGDRTWGRKLREAIIATRLNRKISKDDILYGYLTNVYLGEGAYGIEAASETYFRKPAKDLTLSEAATLVGIIPAPTAYEPRHNTEKAEVKRKAVLAAMEHEGYITKAQQLQADRQTVWSEVKGPPPIGRPVTLVYDRKTIQSKYPYFVDYVRRYLIARYGEEKLRRGGLRVQTTIDPKLQALAEASVAKTLSGTKPPLEMALVSVEPLTGFVKAMVGGRDYNAADGQVNLALGACPTEAQLAKQLGHRPAVPPVCDGSTFGGGSGRSPGSSIKPIVLATAFSEGINPATVYSGAPFKPKCAAKPINNFEGGSYAAVDLRTATIKSINTVFARLGMDVGIGNLAKTAQKLGIESAWYDPTRHCASWAIGGIDVSPLEMASAYAVFAGRGLKAQFKSPGVKTDSPVPGFDAPATPVVSVVDGRGHVLEDNTGDHTVRVLAQNVADNVTALLQGVVDGGTGTRARLPNRPAAGKTGTSQGSANVWFVGYTPTLSTAVWMGDKDKPRTLRNIKGVHNVIGGTFPAQTWQDYMSKAMADTPVTSFTAPAPIKKVQVIDRVLQLQKNLRKGIDPGAKRSVARTGVETFQVSLSGPQVAAPPYLAPSTSAPPTTVAPPPTVAPEPVPPVALPPVEATAVPTTVAPVAPVAEATVPTVAAPPVGAPPVPAPGDPSNAFSVIATTAPSVPPP